MLKKNFSLFIALAFFISLSYRLEADDARLEPPDAEQIEEIFTSESDSDFTYQGNQYFWRDGKLYEKLDNGQELIIEQPQGERFFYEDDSGSQWLSQDAEGNVYIAVSPKILADIKFAYDSDIISENSKVILNEFGKALQKPALIDRRLVIAGHTDNKGSEEYNLKLSRKRAKSVADYLVNNYHIDDSRLILSGYGSSSPVASNETEEGQARNRRVEFILLK